MANGQPVRKLFVLVVAAAMLAGCTMPAPNLPPTVSLLVTPEPATPTAGPTLLPAVVETATALALGTVNPPAEQSPTAEAEITGSPAASATGGAASATPSPFGPTGRPGPVQTATPIFLDDPVDDPALPPGCQAMRTVQPGEWLQLIADDYGLTWQALAAANGLADPEKLTAGQVLCIPAPGVTVTPPGTTGGGSGSRTPTPPPGNGLAILSFAAGPSPVERGNVVQLSWTVRAANSVSLYRMLFDPKTALWFRQESPAYMGTGNGNLTLPVANDAREALRFELVAHDATDKSVGVQSAVLPLLCYVPFYVSPPEPNSCRSAPKTVPGEFQTFEFGYMLWRSDTGEVFILPQRPDDFLAWTIQLPESDPIDVGPAPTGFEAPGFRFSAVWATLDAQQLGGSGLLRDALGWATAPSESYDLTLQPRLDSRYSMFDVVFVSFPDDRIAMLTTGGGLPVPGMFGPAWSFIDR